MNQFIKNNGFAGLSLLFALVLTVMSGIEFLNMHENEKLFPSKDLTKIEMLSKYNASIKDTPGDTEIYFFEGKEPGGKTLILGGTHPNEASSYLTAYLILENVEIKKGTLIIIPRTNNSAFTHNDPMEGQPQFFTIDGRNGPREFRYGSRITNPCEQWPDPEIYLHYPSGQKLAGNETRNLNRSYPGRKDGPITERVSYAVLALINSEKIDLSFDLHEAAPEYPVVNAIVASERSQDIASEAAMELEFEGLEYSIEPSPYNFRGLSHREWQDHSDTYPFLLETANPIQGRLRGRTDEQLLLSGFDKMYLKGAELGQVKVPYDSTGISIEVRIGRHLAAVTKIMEVFNNYFPEKGTAVAGLPSYEELLAKGIGEYF